MSTGLINTSAAAATIPVNNVNSSAPMTPQADIQIAGYLGYLDMLFSQASTPPTGLLEEVNRVITNLNTLQGEVTTDPTLSPLLTAAINQINSAEGATAGTIAQPVTSATLSNVAAAYRSWWTNPTDSKGDTNASAVMSWLSKANFNPSASSPDTIFSILMLLCDTQTYLAGQIGLSTSVNTFFSQSDLYGSSPQVLSQFLMSYVQASNPFSASLLTAILPADSGSTMPNYDAFLNDFKADQSSWPSFPDPSGMMSYWFTPRCDSFFNNLF